MRGAYQRRDIKKEPEPEINRCEGCRHFRRGLINPYRAADGLCLKKTVRKNHANGCEGWEARELTPREKHVSEMQRLAEAIRRTDSEELKRDYGKAMKRMSHELKIYDSLRRQK